MPLRRRERERSSCQVLGVARGVARLSRPFACEITRLLRFSGLQQKSCSQNARVEQVAGVVSSCGRVFQRLEETLGLSEAAQAKLNESSRPGDMRASELKV